MPVVPCIKGYKEEEDLVMFDGSDEPDEGDEE